jgi:glutamate/tyrosine decarboxylase-like PLP-dependent enzyme
MNYLGEAGYLEINRRILAARDAIIAGITPAGLQVWGEPEMGVFAYGSPAFDMRALGARLGENGWLVGYLQEPPGIHLMLTPAHAPVVDEYVAAVLEAAEHADSRVRASDLVRPEALY